MPRIRYNKVVERLNRYEELLLRCLSMFELGDLVIVDSTPIETKALARHGRHRRRGESTLIEEAESMEYNASKRGSTKATKPLLPQTAYTSA